MSSRANHKSADSSHVSYGAVQTVISASPMCVTIIFIRRFCPQWGSNIRSHAYNLQVVGSSPAAITCCFGLQCISIEVITGRTEVANAHSATASATFTNETVVQKVCP